MNQSDRIIDYVKKFGSISPIEAFADLDITKLATRISELRRYKGIEFTGTMVTSKNRYGETCHYMRYRLKEGE